MSDAVEPRTAWGLLIKYRNSPGGFLWAETYAYRHEAIAAYNRSYLLPGQYDRNRRRGWVKAVRVSIQIAEEQDQ